LCQCANLLSLLRRGEKKKGVKYIYVRELNAHAHARVCACACAYMRVRAYAREPQTPRTARAEL
jgi:hypothetical protein